MPRWKGPAPKSAVGYRPIRWRITMSRRFCGGNSVTYVDPSTYNGKWIADGKVAAHEFGHIAGLQDRYVDEDENGQKQSIPYQGWETNIMGAKKGEVEQRNIDDILKRPFEHYHDIKDSWWKSWFQDANSYLIQTIDK